MKIAQILPSLNIGGVERGVLDIANYFKNTDIENIVISKGGRLVKELDKIKIKHYTLPVNRKSLVSLFLIPKLKKIFLKEKIDIVHARSRVPAWISFFASRLAGIDFITTCHGVYKNKFFSKVMGFGKFVICPSNFVARYMREKFSVPEEKIVVIPRWVDLNRFKYTPYKDKINLNVILAVGRISPSKGYEYLIDAFKVLVRNNPYLKLKIVGEPDKSKIKYFNYLKSLINRFSLNYNVEFVGFKKNIEDLLKEAKILVVPSVIEESFSRVVIEAFASGVLVVATKVGGISEIIEDGVNGFLVEPRNSKEIAYRINKLLNEPKLANNFSINARKKTESFYNIDKCLEKNREVYQKTIKTKRILIIKISSFGDLILSLPSFKAIRENFLESKIYCLTLKKYAPILYNCPYIDKIITVDNDYKRLKNILKISKELLSLSFDYIIDLQNNRASHLISFLSFPKESFGYSLKFGFLLKHKLRYKPKDPLSSQEDILKLLGIKFKEKRLIFWDVPGSSLLKNEKFIGICVSASLSWKSKNYPVENIIDLINLISKNFLDYKIVLFGEKSSIDTGRKIEESIKTKIYNLCGKTQLEELPKLIKKMKVFISPDTGLLHLALANNIPTIALFGPTSPFRHTIKDKNLYILYKKLKCSFCYRKKCKFKENFCLKSIKPEEILLTIKNILKKDESLNTFHAS